MITHKCIKLFGVAGSGKTTTCCNIISFLTGFGGDGKVNEWFGTTRTYDITEICFTSFTNAAIRSIKDKIVKNTHIIMPKEKSSEDLFRTLNSLTWMLSGFSKRQQMSEYKKKQFFKDELNISTQRNMEEQSDMDRYIDVYKNIQVRTGKFFNEVADEDVIDIIKKVNEEKAFDTNAIEPISAKSILKRYHQWKVENDYKDYEDSIIHCIRNKIDVPCQVLIVDEAQDLSYVQTLLIDLWTKFYDKQIFIISGDDDQCVYQCFGATPEYLINYTNTNMDKRFLEETYRLPNNIALFNNSILGTMKFREAKLINSSKEDGVLKYHNVSKNEFMDMFNKIANIEKANIFLLFRTNKIKNKIAEYLFEETNAPFGHIGSSIGKWNYRFVCIINALNKLNTNQKLNQQEVEMLFDVLPAKTCLVRGMKTKIINDGKENGHLKLYSTQDVLAMTIWSQKRLDITDYQDKNFKVEAVKDKIIPYIEFESTSSANMKAIMEADSVNRLYRSKLKNSNFIVEKVDYVNKTIQKFNIRLGTFHSSKGLEADNVFVFLGTSYFFRNIDDSERRCLYVACSRAKRSLHLIGAIGFGHKTELEDDFRHIIAKHCK